MITLQLEKEYDNIKKNIKIDNKIRKNKVFRNEEILITNNKKEIYYYLLNDFSNIYKLLEYKTIEDVIDLLFENIKIEEEDTVKEYCFINYFIKYAIETNEEIDFHNYYHHNYNDDFYYYDDEAYSDNYNKIKTRINLLTLIKLNIVNVNNFTIITDFKNYVLNDNNLLLITLEKEFNIDYKVNDILKIDSHINRSKIMEFLLTNIFDNKKLSKNDFYILKKYICSHYYTNIFIPYIDVNIFTVNEKESLLKNKDIMSLSLFNYLFKKSDEKYQEYLLSMLYNLSSYENVANNYRDELINILKTQDVLKLYKRIESKYKIKGNKFGFNNHNKYMIFTFSEEAPYSSNCKQQRRIYTDFIKDLNIKSSDINNNLLMNIYNMCNPYSLFNFIDYIIKNEDIYYDQNLMIEMIHKINKYINHDKINKNIIKIYDSILDYCLYKKLIMEELINININSVKKNEYEYFILNKSNEKKEKIKIIKKL